jgi:nucleotide-binding universal stress UspA family protein
VQRLLLVPLDGSELGEVAVPVAVALAQCLKASIVLSHIHERDAPVQIHGQRHLREPEEAEAYLRAVRENLIPPDVETECRVTVGEGRREVARSIVRQAEDLGAYMVVMCTHGWGGLRDVLFGSVAQQVLAQGRTPVLVVRPKALPLSSFALRTLMVPLDGKPSHEVSLRIAEELATACHAELILVTVIPTAESLSGEEAVTRILLPGAVEAMLDLAEQGAAQYLAGLVAQLESKGHRAGARVLRGVPDASLVALARQERADVIVLATHRRVGFEAFWSGSMAPKIAARCDLPLLLVPVVDG